MKITRYISLALLLLPATLFVSCENWLDVTASNEIRKEDHYSSELGFQQTLIGCYIAMATPELYGRALVWNEIERMARQYTAMPLATSEYPGLYELEAHDYDDADSESIINGIWQKLYNVIANANDALSMIDEKKNELSTIGYNIIKGELLAVRAYVHFDLLRLFGYGDWASRANEMNAKLTVPYVTTLSPSTPPQTTGADYLQHVIDDLQEAARLMKNDDPVVGKRPESDYASINYDGFYDYREGHLNYYAVQALLARVCMWSGSDAHRTLALEAAQKVISRIENQPEYVMPSKMFNLQLQNTLTTANRSMYPEYLFSLEVYDMNASQESLLTMGTTQDSEAIYLSESTVQEISEGALSDIRFNTAALLTIENGFIPLKLLDNANVSGTSEQTMRSRNRVPLIRIPEVYYIASECYAMQQDLDKAADMLDVIRTNRGIAALDRSTVNTQEAMIDEITKEYRREFISEGVMFFYYKRTGATEMPNVLECTDATYVLPYPYYEISIGRIQ